MSMSTSATSTPPPRKLRVAVLYGGRSGEHEVSLQSAASVLRNLDRERFEAIPIAIDKEGRWHPGDVALIDQGARTLPVFKDQPPVLLPPSPRAGGAELVPYGETALHKRGLPLPAVLAFGAGVLELVGGIALAAGFKARWSALALAVFTLLATFIFHAYWSVPAEQQMVQQLMFMKNLAITGGLLMVFSFGAGPASLDQRSGAAAKLATA